MYADRTIYCSKCKRETWEGSKCPATDRKENCSDREPPKKESTSK